MVIQVDPSKAVAVSVSYVDAGYKASWLEVQVFAGSSFPRVLLVDVVTPADLVTLATEKALEDGTNELDDLISKGFTKAAADSFSMVDMVDIEVVIQKVLADSQAVADAAAKVFTKGLFDNTAGFVDVARRSFTKRLADATSGFTDNRVISFTKRPTDSISLVDSVDIEYWIEKLLADSATLSDDTDLAINKPLDNDSAEISDEFSSEPIKTFEDALDEPIDELTALDVEKGLEETLTPTDLAVATLVFIRDLDDLMTSTDESSWEFSREESETLEAIDESVVSVDQGLSENLNLIDNMDGDIEYDIIKLVGELLITSDGQVIDFATQSSDNVLTSSSGVLVQQDYCDITYFLTDYVGESRTFT